MMTSPDSRGPVIAYLGLGSNLGDRVAHIEGAIARIEALKGTALVARSSMYESEPWFVADQPAFVNACIGVKSSGSARELLEALLAIEVAMGRVRHVPKGPRTIDLDILLWGDRIVDEPGLTIPHPGVLDRPFVLVPLVEIAADVVHPKTGRTLAEHLEKTDFRAQVSALA